MIAEVVVILTRRLSNVAIVRTLMVLRAIMETMAILIINGANFCGQEVDQSEMKPSGANAVSPKVFIVIPTPYTVYTNGVLGGTVTQS